MTSKYLAKNMGSLDRSARAFVVAPLAIVAGLALGAASIPGTVLFVLAGVALATAATGRCPGYVLVGIDTRRRGAALPHRAEPPPRTSNANTEVRP